jgi:TonB family protein
MRLLVETKLDLARRVLANKDYEGAIAQASQLLTVDSHNPEALGIREQARSAIREIAASVAAVRDAVNRGDSAQAAAALERVLALDPRNPIVAEASRQLNANFAQRATGAKTEMEQARLRANAKGGAAQDPAFAEGETLAESAARSLKDRQFTTAAQTYLQARDAYDRARHVIEGQEAAAALEVRRAAATAVAKATPAAGTGEKWRDLPVYAEADVDKAPLPFSHEIPKPRVDKQASVILSWVVTPEGLVDDVKIVSSTSPEASALVVEGLKTWRYEPGQKDGKPVPVRVLRKYTFTPRS